MKSNFTTSFFDFIFHNKVLKLFGVSVAIFTVVRWFFYINKYAVNILYADQWGFYRSAFDNYSFWKTFSLQHGPHRQGIGFVITRFVDDLSDWNTRATGFVIGVFMLLTAIVYLVLKKKIISKIQFVDLIIVLVVLTPAQYALFANVPNLSHGAMPAFLLSLFVLSLTVKNVYLRGTLLIIINFNMVYSAFGLFLGLITPFVFLLDAIRYKSLKCKPELIFSLFLILISLLSFASFFIGYHMNPVGHASVFSHPRPWEYFYFIAMAYVNFAYASLRFPLLGMIVIIPMIVVLVKHIVHLLKTATSKLNVDITKSLIIVVLISFSLIFISVSAIGRIAESLHNANASRYIPYLISSVVAMYFHISTMKTKWSKPLIVGMLIVVSLSVLPDRDKGMLSSRKLEWKTEYLKTENIEETNIKTGFRIHPYPERVHLEERLQFLKENKLNLFLDKED